MTRTNPFEDGEERSQAQFHHSRYTQSNSISNYGNNSARFVETTPIPQKPTLILRKPPPRPSLALTQPVLIKAKAVPGESLKKIVEYASNVAYPRPKESDQE